MILKNIKEAVRFYHSQGFRCMPIHSVDKGCKHPKVVGKGPCGGQCYGKVPTTEHWPDQHYTENNFNDDSNIALIMGKQLDGRWFVGLDIDGELNLSEFLIDLPPTLESTTQRGKHLIFEVAPDSPLGNWNDIFLTRSKTIGYRSGYKGAVDLKYCRGAMVSPPSRTKNGSEYSWLEWRQPALLPRSEVLYLLRKRKFAHPNIKYYARWSMYPSHYGKNP